MLSRQDTLDRGLSLELTANGVSPSSYPLNSRIEAAGDRRTHPNGSLIKAGDVVFPHPGLQGRPLQAEPGSRPIRSPDLSLSFLQHLQDSRRARRRRRSKPDLAALQERTYPSLAWRRAAQAHCSKPPTAR